jgi:hypothetical protein
MKIDMFNALLFLSTKQLNIICTHNLWFRSANSLSQSLIRTWYIGIIKDKSSFDSISLASRSPDHESVTKAEIGRQSTRGMGRQMIMSLVLLYRTSFGTPVDPPGMEDYVGTVLFLYGVDTSNDRLTANIRSIIITLLNERNDFQRKFDEGVRRVHQDNNYVCREPWGDEEGTVPQSS